MTSEQQAALSVSIEQLALRLGWRPEPHDRTKWSLALPDGNHLKVIYRPDANVMVNYHSGGWFQMNPIVFCFYTVTGGGKWFEFLQQKKKAWEEKTPGGITWTQHYALLVLRTMEQEALDDLHVFTTPTPKVNKPFDAAGYLKALTAVVEKPNQARLYLTAIRQFPDEFVERMFADHMLHVSQSITGFNIPKKPLLLFPIRTIEGHTISLQHLNYQPMMKAYWNGNTIPKSEYKFLGGTTISGGFFSPDSIERIRSAPVIILVEGPMDALAIASLRRETSPVTVVASLGTGNAMTIYLTLRASVPNAKILLALDNDDTGKRTAERILAKHSADLHLISALPPAETGAKDWDEFVRWDKDAAKRTLNLLIGPVKQRSVATSKDSVSIVYPRSPEEVAISYPPIPILLKRIKEYANDSATLPKHRSAALSLLTMAQGTANHAYVQPKLHLYGTKTGRHTTTGPAIQNLHRELRQIIASASGMVEGDMSQADIRSLAIVSGDTNLMNFLRGDGDFYLLVASEVYGISESEVTPNQRNSVKSPVQRYWNGGQEYDGESPIEAQVRAAMDALLPKRFPLASKFRGEIFKQWKQNGFMKRGLTGPEVPFPTAERPKSATAFSLAVQGTSAELFDRWLREILPVIADEKLGIPVMFIYDSVYFVPSKPECTPRIADIMQQGIKAVTTHLGLPIPVLVDVKFH